MSKPFFVRGDKGDLDAVVQACVSADQEARMAAIGDDRTAGS